MKLFPREKVVGIFRGFGEGGLEFHADLVLPYRNEFQSSPMHGQFLLVQLETEHEAVLGRITSLSSEGRLASSTGEDFGLRAVAEDRIVPEDLREQYLKYRVDIRVLGVLRIQDDKAVFVASHRRLPHVGSRVAFLSDEILCEVAGHNLPGAELGFFALGEFIFSGQDRRLLRLPWMQIKSPAVTPRFPIGNLVSRRSFIFARAGFGKSNLNKLLFANLYQDTPTVKKRGNRDVAVGTIIFDPDGEYFWPDDKNRPGLCDVSHLRNKIVVFTAKTGPSPFYDSFIAGSIKLDIRRLRPTDVVSIALSPEKQDQQNVRKLKGMNDQDWRTLVDEIYQNGNAADGDTIKGLLRLEPGQDAEMVAARANMSIIVRMLHDPSSQMMDMIIYALKHGKICIVDVSQMRGAPALVLSGLILQRIFDHNQQEFTKAHPETIPTIAVLEEAQSVLGNSSTSGEGPYVAWVKEGRKYDLGAVLVTQQPGSISAEILSQGDNWFVFHLLSSSDLDALRRANAHYSNDLLSALLNEPIEGNGVMWSSAGGKSYPIPVRVMSFEQMYQALDPDYSKPGEATFARELKDQFARAAERPSVAIPREGPAGSAVPRVPSTPVDHPADAEQPADILETYTQRAIVAFRNDNATVEKVRKWGLPWRGVLEVIKASLPEVLDEEEKGKLAYNLVSPVMNAVFGEGRWETQKRPSKSRTGATTTYVVLKPE